MSHLIAILLKAGGSLRAALLLATLALVMGLCARLPLLRGRGFLPVGAQALGLGALAAAAFPLVLAWSEAGRLNLASPQEFLLATTLATGVLALAQELRKRCSFAASLALRGAVLLLLVLAAFLRDVELPLPPPALGGAWLTLRTLALAGAFALLNLGAAEALASLPSGGQRAGLAPLRGAALLLALALCASLFAPRPLAQGFLPWNPGDAPALGGLLACAVPLHLLHVREARPWAFPATLLGAWVLYVLLWAMAGFHPGTAFLL